ncbi:MAG: hypothetical protein K0S48_415 [Ramlibacter sp.]|jgi:mono/diheme cytochrome c family protein|nr:hypothetical protein [Ramlibacter sp.]MCE3270552.1 hypothetical protein [Ramlibacter sp.]
MMRWLAAVLALCALPAAAQLGNAYAQVLAATSKPLLSRDSADARAFRGSVVFGTYCVTCHGANADGRGRAARLYNPAPANLRESDKNAEYIKLIVRIGGKAIARSEFMPPWGEELTEEQISDVTAYLQSINTRRR